MMARAPDIAAFGGDVFNCDPNPLNLTHLLSLFLH